MNDKQKKCWTVPRLHQPFEIDGEWDKKPWKEIEALQLNNYMGEKPRHRPDTHVKIAYDDKAIYVIFRVDDKYIRCVVNQYQGPVCNDSCVEFFFTPGTDISKGYLNLEVNCGGTALFAFQKKQGIDRVDIPKPVFDRIKIAHSLPVTVEPEITERTTWTVEYRLPVDILFRYTDVIKPDSGVEWKANFYKIASDSSHPHYLTWSLVKHPVPQFHLPEFFGTLKFE